MKRLLEGLEEHFQPGVIVLIGELVSEEAKSQDFKKIKSQVDFIAHVLNDRKLKHLQEKT